MATPTTEKTDYVLYIGATEKLRLKDLRAMMVRARSFISDDHDAPVITITKEHTVITHVQSLNVRRNA